MNGIADIPGMTFAEHITRIDEEPVLKNAYTAFSEGSYVSSASEFGDSELPEAVYCLAFHHLNGRGVKKDSAKALALFTGAMEKGYLPAISEVAQCYGYGIGTETDDGKAFELFSKAADEGDPYGMAMLSMMYRNGDGVKRSNKLADEWSERCDQSGDADEIEDLGLEYLVNGNVILGRLYLMRSAVMGAPVSAKALEIIYTFGVGVKEDEYEASDWADTADANGWEDVTREDLKGYDDWFAKYIDLDDMEE